MTSVPFMLLAFAVVIAATGWTAAFALQAALSGRNRPTRVARVLGAGLLAGIGSWSAQCWTFLAAPHIAPMATEAAVAAGAALIAVAMLGSAFAVAEWRPSHWVSGAVLAGSGAAQSLMVSLNALRLDGAAVDMRAQAGWLLLCGVMVGAGFALWQTGRWRRLSPLIGLGVGAVLTATAYLSLGSLPELRAAASGDLDLLGTREVAVITALALTLVLMGAYAVAFTSRASRTSALASLQRAIDALSPGLAIFDAEGRLSSLNASYGSFFQGLSLPMAPGADRRKLLQAASAEGWLDDGAAQELGLAFGAPPPAARKGPIRLELRLPDGRWLAGQSIAMDDGGRAVILNDITSARADVQALAAGREEIDAAALLHSDTPPAATGAREPPLAVLPVRSLAAVPTAANARVLVVDSDPAKRKMLSLLLETEGYACVLAQNGLEAVERASAEAFAAIFIALPTPSTEGIEAIRSIRAAQSRVGGGASAIFSISSPGSGRPWEAAMAAGADGHLAEPVVASQLAAALRSQAERIGGGAPAARRVVNS